MKEYQNPLVERYASKEISYIFSPEFKFRTWRRLWIALAIAEKKLGLSITDEQIKELEKHKDDINYDVAKKKEKEIRHDVVAHIYAYGVQCPKAKPIIHLGATSAFVVDNTDLIEIKEALHQIKIVIINLIRQLSAFAKKNKSLPTLGFTHYQPAQLTTVGKRACLWLQDIVLDYHDLEYRLSNLPFRGAKGTTGTQASFMKLFNNDEKKVKRLDQLVAEEMGFDKQLLITGQTYTRKIDSQILDLLSGIAQSASKFSNDIRLLSNLKEIEEPYEKKQVGSSAMPYKRNPMRSERLTSLSRYLISLAQNPHNTASTQWFERTLDDSANRRLAIPQAFLTADAILHLYLNIASGLVVYPKMIRKHIDEELPFIATENILMQAVKKGGDRQTLHEKIRQYSFKAAQRIKMEGSENNLIDLILRDKKSFKIEPSELKKLLDPSKYVGRAPQQVDEFLKKVVKPILEKNKAVSKIKPKVEV